MEEKLITSTPEADTALALPADAQAETTPADTTQASGADGRKEQFDRLIRGEYKAAFDERVQKIIDRRFRENRSLKEQAARTQPLLDFLKQTYGETDDEGLYRKVARAHETRPTGPDPAGQARTLLRDQGAREIMQKWQRQTAEAQKLHPGLDLNREAGNSRFAALLAAGVDVRTAYEVVHAEALMQNAMRYAAERTRERTLNDIRARGLRPEENGADGRGATRVTPPRVRDMTRAQRDEIERRAARGEKVYFN